MPVGVDPRVHPRFTSSRQLGPWGQAYGCPCEYRDRVLDSLQNDIPRVQGEAVAKEVTDS